MSEDQAQRWSELRSLPPAPKASGAERSCATCLRAPTARLSELNVVWKPVSDASADPDLHSVHAPQGNRLWDLRSVHALQGNRLWDLHSVHVPQGMGYASQGRAGRTNMPTSEGPVWTTRSGEMSLRTTSTKGGKASFMRSSIQSKRGSELEQQMPMTTLP